MSSPIVTSSASLQCSHAGSATATAPFPRVTIDGSPVVTLSCPYTIAGCSLTGSPTSPCVSGQFVSGALRVTAGGTPVALQSSPTTTLPLASPMMVISTQSRVLAL